MRINKISIRDPEGVFNAKTARAVEMTPLYGWLREQRQNLSDWLQLYLSRGSQWIRKSHREG